MNKLVIGVVDTHVQTALTRPGFEEHQVPREQVILVYLGTDSGLLACLSGQTQIKPIPESHQYKARTIDTPPAHTAVTVRRAPPVAKLIVKVGDNGDRVRQPRIWRWGPVVATSC